MTSNNKILELVRDISVIAGRMDERINFLTKEHDIIKKSFQDLPEKLMSLRKELGEELEKELERPHSPCENITSLSEVVQGVLTQLTVLEGKIKIIEAKTKKWNSIKRRIFDTVLTIIGTLIAAYLAMKFGLVL